MGRDPADAPPPRHPFAAGTRFTDLRYYGTPARGGHFAAFVQPEIFAAEVRAGFVALRT